MSHRRSKHTKFQNALKVLHLMPYPAPTVTS